MTNVMDQLHADHINIARIIDLLKHQYEEMRRDGSPDFNLMLDIMDYIHSYPDYVHHPKENVVFKVYLEHHKDMQDTIQALMIEHQEMVQKTRDLHDAIDGILNDSLVDKAELELQLAEFIAQQIRHMDTEEAKVFPMLRNTLNKEDLAHIEAELPTEEDPLFGEVVRKRFEALYQHITATT
ncbi:MAG: hemerythrin domain-containing protein [Pseudomonadota bacterium]